MCLNTEDVILATEGQYIIYVGCRFCWNSGEISRIVNWIFPIANFTSINIPLWLLFRITVPIKKSASLNVILMIKCYRIRTWNMLLLLTLLATVPPSMADTVRYRLLPLTAPGRIRDGYVGIKQDFYYSSVFSVSIC